jgi:metal-responsive CopG/Arc/MetJ family transcriptional regulator
MKTAISIPDAVFEAADQLAARIGLSRSELYANAVAEFMARHRAAGVRERMDAVYEIHAESARLESVLAIVQSESVAMEDW